MHKVNLPQNNERHLQNFFAESHLHLPQVHFLFLMVLNRPEVSVEKIETG